MDRDLLAQLLSDLGRVRVAVIGDFCLDAYWLLDASLSEISIETGLATRAVRTQRYSLGGAGNVVSNLVALGVRAVSVFGVIGEDPFGREMLRILSAARVDTRGMRFQIRDWQTPVYTKPIEGEHEQNRIDFGNANSLDGETSTGLLRDLEAALPKLDLVIVNQQLLHGIHTEEVRGDLARIIASSTVPFVSDSRAYSDSYTGALRKLNDREALRLCGREWTSEAPVPRALVCQAAEELYGRWGKTLFVTRGARGMLVRDPDGARDVPGLQILGPIDTVGAGDSALAGIAAALAAGRDALTAATLGNLVAGVTVQKLYTTGTASPEEVLALGADPIYVERPELAEDVRQARYHGRSEIEIVSALPARPGITHAVFDNDGTISTLREGWETIMEPVMVRSILGPGWKNAERGLYERVRERVRDYIDKTTGVQTLSQMQGLVEMVRQFGVVPSAQIKDEHGYKAVYNEELLALVRGRIAKLRAGELSVQDYTLAGAITLLQSLRAAGVRMYLASGTDQEDVAAEAEALGFAGFFQGRIHGAVGDVKVEAKRVVLERILAEIGREGGVTLVTFGDGPVEIRETRRRGGYAVGVASDEVRRFGLNPRKRTRLIRAGADLVVPDFTQRAALLALFGIQA